MYCSAEIFGDILVTFPEEGRAQKQVIHSSARELSVGIAPAIRLACVEIEAAELGEHRRDLGRQQDALEHQGRLTELHIDLSTL